MMRKKELMLLSCLRSNARETLTSISKKTKIPISTIFDKLKEYEKGFIRKHTSLIDFKKLGYDIRIHLLLKIQRDKRTSFETFIMANQSVNNVFRINNIYDYFVEAIFRNIKDFQEFADKLESYGVSEITEHFVIDELKRETFLSDTNFIELLT
jgi:DNA-binding Lrp family transcriptional regulator